MDRINIACRGWVVLVYNWLEMSPFELFDLIYALLCLLHRVPSTTLAIATTTTTYAASAVRPASTSTSAPRSVIQACGRRNVMVRLRLEVWVVIDHAS